MVTAALPGHTSHIHVIFLHIVMGQSGTRTPTFPFWQWNSLKYKKDNWNILRFRLGYQQEKAFSLSDAPTSDIPIRKMAWHGVRKGVWFTHNKVGTKKWLDWDYKISISFKIGVSTHKPRTSGWKQPEQCKNGPRLCILKEGQVPPKYEVGWTR